MGKQDMFVWAPKAEELKPQQGGALSGVLGGNRPSLVDPSRLVVYIKWSFFDPQRIHVECEKSNIHCAITKQGVMYTVATLNNTLDAFKKDQPSLLCANLQQAYKVVGEHLGYDPKYIESLVSDLCKERKNSKNDNLNRE